MAVSARAGFHFLQRRPKKARYRALLAYLRSLEPRPSPHRRPDGSLTDAARRGKKLFHSKKVGCADCHPAPLYSDGKRHNVGTRAPFDKTARFDTPSLIEVYRTAPYLHDGSAATLREVLTEDNQKDQHGVTSHLSDRQIHDLVQYMLSLDRIGSQDTTQDITQGKK
jgi:cytochrome c peroxidase